MQITLPGVAASGIILAFLILGADKASDYGMRHRPIDRTAATAQQQATGGPREAAQSAGTDEAVGGGRQTNPATALRQDQEKPANQPGGKIPEQGPVRSTNGLQPAGQTSPKAAALPPGTNQPSTAKQHQTAQLPNGR